MSALVANRAEGSEHRQLGYVLQVTDIKSLNSKAIARIRDAVYHHGMVVIPGQQLGPRNLHDFTAAIGEIIELTDGTQFGEREGELRTVVRVSNMKPDGTIMSGHKGAIEWHTDSDFCPAPYNRTFNFLYAEVVPDQGGETLFADAEQAYHDLSAADVHFLSQKKIIVEPKLLEDFADDCKLPPAQHPILLVHPKTKQMVIYVSGPTNRIKLSGENLKQSQLLLAKYQALITQPKNIYQHHYRKGDLVIWDNLSTLHRSAGNYGDQPRLLYRTQALLK